MAAEPSYLTLDQQARLPVAQPQQQPHVVILEQPASRALRFRYQCEGRYPGTLVGVSSTAENKTYPTIKVMGVQKPAVVVVSCVTKDQPYRVHPHNLVGKEGCKNGICTQHLKPDMTCTFTSLGIQCVKRRDVEQNLLQRENIRVDPFRNGFAHKDQAASIDLNAVRLCFQVFLEGSQPGKFTVPLHPIVSDIIYDRRFNFSNLCESPSVVCFLLCADDIEVWFEEERDGQTVWKERAELLPNGVHKQVAICFRTPRYRDPIMADVPVDVHLLLRRPSDGALSEPRAFTLHPNERDPEAIERKKRKIGEGYFDRYFQESVLLGASAGRSPVPEAMVAATAMQQQHHPMMQQAGAPTMAQLTPVNPQYRGEVAAVAPPAYEPEVVETAEKLDSLDLGIDPNDIALTSGDLNMNLSDLASAPNLSLVNLSASLFDSGNNIASESNLMEDGRGLLNDLGGSRVFKTEPS
ncbi:hypothetical protein HPB52_023015 [Rhipicephalus sanguineus]|uniref:RHD domain-containing protein n=1 Tax=Rhipicephalus sanguineus TaxID=34632 RepID=A0A9D4PG78_RHISA|nr:hypothetical protein HPB52_023015 [Rhipicephalus sanguineus]